MIALWPSHIPPGLVHIFYRIAVSAYRVIVASIFKIESNEAIMDIMYRLKSILRSKKRRSTISICPFS